MDLNRFFRMTREEQEAALCKTLRAADDAAQYARLEVEKVKAKLSDSQLLQEKNKFEKEAFNLRQQVQRLLAANKRQSDFLDEANRQVGEAQDEARAARKKAEELMKLMEDPA